MSEHEKNPAESAPQSDKLRDLEPSKPSKASEHADKPDAQVKGGARLVWEGQRD